MDLQWSNTFFLSATSEEGPKWIKLWQPGFRHSFIAPKQDFKDVIRQKPALALGLNEHCLIPAFWGKILSLGTVMGQEDGPYSHGNPAPPEAWLFDTDFSRTRLSSYVQAQLFLLPLLARAWCRWLKWWVQFSWFWTAICSGLLLPNHTNTHPACCKYQKQLKELSSSLLPCGKTAKGKKETALRKPLFVLAPWVQCWCEGPVPGWAICWREQWETRAEWFFWHLPHSAGLCESHLALHCCCSLIRSNHQTAHVPGEHGGLCSAAPGCSSPTHLPLNLHIYLYFSTRIKGEKGGKCQQLISRLVLKFCFSMANVRICINPFKRWNKANELAVQELWFCAWPWRDRETGSRGNIKTKYLFAECLCSLTTLWYWGVLFSCSEQAQHWFRMMLKFMFKIKLFL